MRYSYTREVPIDGYLPSQEWITRSGYSGYVYRNYLELTRNNTWKATYTGTLYKHVAPVKVEDKR